MTSRVLTPELLDELPANDPAAIHSRRDLRHLNSLMGHAHHIAGALRRFPTTKRITDLGGGDGMVMLRVAQQLRWRDIELTIVDRTRAISAETEAAFSELGWRVTVAQADVFAALRELVRPGAITANLFLHHFTDEQLRELFSLAARSAQVLIGCEPRRRNLALLASRCVGLIGCNQVTRHDALVSVRAGFRGNELTRLWPAGKWSCRERGVGLFSHLFVAQRL